MTEDDWRPLAAVQALEKRGAIVWAIRQFFHAAGYVEVHTPTLSATRLWIVISPARGSLVLGRLRRLRLCESRRCSVLSAVFTRIWHGSVCWQLG